MKIHNDTKNKIMALLGITSNFIDVYKVDKSPDEIFIITAFEESLNSIANDLVTRSFKSDEFNDEIYNFDNIMSAWMDNLTYKYDSNIENKNTIYDVLFSVLQGIQNIIDEDYFAWEKDQSFDEDGGSIGEEQFWEKDDESSDDDETIESSSPDRSFPD